MKTITVTTLVAFAFIAAVNAQSDNPGYIRFMELEECGGEEMLRVEADGETCHTVKSSKGRTGGAVLYDFDDPGTGMLRVYANKKCKGAKKDQEVVWNECVDIRAYVDDGEYGSSNPTKEEEPNLSNGSSSSSSPSGRPLSPTMAGKGWQQAVDDALESLNNVGSLNFWSDGCSDSDADLTVFADASVCHVISEDGASAEGFVFTDDGDNGHFYFFESTECDGSAYTDYEVEWNPSCVDLEDLVTFDGADFRGAGLHKE